jgi:hypothetical protein
MNKIPGLLIGLFCLFSAYAHAENLPKVTGLALSGDQLTWDAQDGATGYNIHRDYAYFDTVRGALSYTVTEPGNYHVISFNDNGEYGVTLEPEEAGQPYTFVTYTEADTTTLPKVTGLALTGNQLTWDAQDGATGYNIHLDYQYFDTVRGALSYTVTEPGRYHVISFNDNGQFGVTRDPEEGGQPYTYVEYNGCVEQAGLDNSCAPGLSLSDPDYFKEVALNVEFGSASSEIRKWLTDIRYFVSGEVTAELAAELDRVVAELNSLVGVQLIEVSDTTEANFQIFFGSGEDYANNLEPNALDLIGNNNGLVWLYWNSEFEIYRGSMYVDVFRASSGEFQNHILREELTQGLGLLNDSFKYPDSIFYEPFSLVTEYSAIDREVIQALYDDAVLPGMTEEDIDQLIQ